MIAVMTLLMASSLHAVSPTLIALGVNETPKLELTTGVDYLIMINNENPHGTNFYFGEFAQNVFTHYLQGSSSVTQDSIAVPSHAKVLWLFSPTKAGEYDYYAIDGSNDQKGQKGKIVVKQAESTFPENPDPLEILSDAESVQNGLTVTAPEEEKPASEEQPKRRWLRGGRRD